MRFLSTAFALVLGIGAGISAALGEARQFEASSGVAAGSSGGDDAGAKPLPWYMLPEGGHQKNTTGRGANFKKGQPAGDAGRSKVGKKGVNFRQGLPDGKRGRAIGRKVQDLRSLLKYTGRKSRAGMGTTSQASSESSSVPIRNRPMQQTNSLPPAPPTQYSLQLLTPGPVGRPAVTQPSRLSALPSLGQQFSLPLHSLETQQPQRSSPSPSFPNPFPQASSYSSSHQTQPHSASQRSPPGTPTNAQMWDPFASLAHDPTDGLPMFTWD